MEGVEKMFARMLPRSLCLGVVVLLVGVVSGCMNKGFVYPINAGNLYSEPDVLVNRPVYVVPFSDERPPEYNSLKRSNLAMIPLVPFSTGSIEHPEQKWRRAFQPQFSFPRDDEPKRRGFVPVCDTLTEAVYYSATQSRLFSRVEPAPAEIPAGSLVLDCRLLGTKMTLSKLLMGYPFLAIVPWYVMALPKGVAGNSLDIELVLSNAGQVVWRYPFSKYSSKVFGGYYNRDNLFIGYPEGMQEGMNEALADLAAAMRREPEKFR